MRNKFIYIIVGVLALVVIFLGKIFFYSATPAKEFCGDGVCQTNESCENCLEDCGICLSKPTIKPIFFWGGGVRNVNDDKKYLSDLGIKNAETDVMWGGPEFIAIESTKGVYNFDNLDSAINTLESAGITKICLAINPTNNLYGIEHAVIKTGEQWTAYANFLKALVNKFPNIDCFQIVRELNEEKFSGTPEQYAELIKFSNEIIKVVNPDAIIVFGALAYDFREKIGRTYFLKDVINVLPNDKKYFDMIDIHLHDGGDEIATKENGAALVEKAFNLYKSQLEGIYSNIKISFETSAYTGSPNNMPYQTEQDQADDVIARLNKLTELGAYIK